MIWNFLLWLVTSGLLIFLLRRTYLSYKYEKDSPLKKKTENTAYQNSRIELYLKAKEFNPFTDPSSIYLLINKEFPRIRGEEDVLKFKIQQLEERNLTLEKVKQIANSNIQNLINCINEWRSFAEKSNEGLINLKRERDEIELCFIAEYFHGMVNVAKIHGMVFPKERYLAWANTYHRGLATLGQSNWVSTYYQEMNDRERNEIPTEDQFDDFYNCEILKYKKIMIRSK